MGTKSASKYVSLNKLEEIKANGYLSKTGKDYDNFEVDSMIIEKKSKQAENYAENILKEYEKNLDNY